MVAKSIAVSNKRKITTTEFQQNQLRGYFAPIFGLVCGILRLPLYLTERMFLRCVLRDVIAASSRLNIIGPLQGVRLQADFAGKIEIFLKQFEEHNGKGDLKSRDASEGCFGSTFENSTASDTTTSTYAANLTVPAPAPAAAATVAIVASTSADSTFAIATLSEHSVLSPSSNLVNESKDHSIYSAKSTSHKSNEQKMGQKSQLKILDCHFDGADSYTKQPSHNDHHRYAPGLPAQQSKRQCVPMSTAPILELLQARHDILYSRLFNS